MSQRLRKRQVQSESDSDESDSEAKSDGVMVDVKPRIKKIKAAEDDAFEMEPKARSSGSLSDQEKSVLTGKLVRLALAHAHKQTPMTRTIINTLVLGDYSRMLPKVLDWARDALLSVAGLDIVPMIGEDPQGKAKKGQGAWMVVNVLPAKFRSLVPLPKAAIDDVDAELVHAFVMMLVALIVLHNGSVLQPVLFRHLERMGFIEEQPHPVFGVWTDVLETVCKTRKYVRRAPVAGRGSTLEYRVGERARAELDERQVLAFVADVYGDQGIDPQTLKELRDKQKQKEDEGAPSWAIEEPEEEDKPEEEENA